MKAWWKDTLFKRLFILMWAALVISHVVALSVITHWMLPPPPGDGPSPFSLLTLPPAPPLPLMVEMHSAPRHAEGWEEPPQFGHGASHVVGRIGPGVAFTTHAGPGQPLQPDELLPRFPSGLLLVDYGVRVLIIGLAAWFGARWLSVPMRRLVSASRSLGGALQSGDSVPRLDEGRGTVEVRETARVFNEMAGQLDQQFKSRALLMAAISHDLRTPLTRMRMLLETMAEQPAAQRCIGSVREMNEMIDTVFDVFRGSRFAEPPQVTDVHALVQSLADDLVEQGQRVTLDGEAALAKVEPAALRRVVSNLLGNAVRYGDRAEVEVGADAGGVTIRIDDHGPGIAPEQLAQVFEPFYRIEASRNRHTGGIGLGLYIARDLVARQGGRLELSNLARGGLRAQVWLPPVDAMGVAPAA
ncbi:MAG TPA: ATP-binding protein [Albitalea sp.]|uniref:ATP-binding protein n=1 Tax=Piscinibacter sp. TaxID=1903157 RepID=UPI002ED46A4B